MPRTAFESVQQDEVLRAVTSQNRSRWVLLIGSPIEPMHGYLLDAIDSLPIYRNLRFGAAQTWRNHPELQAFLETASLAMTPAILLVKNGHVEATISGAVPFDLLKRSVDDLCNPSPTDRLAEAMLEADEKAATTPDPLSPRWEAVGVTADGRTLWAEALPAHRTEAGPRNCATCDGGGCPDCTDPV
ncbi:thioredoxin [Gordonia phage Commandaria]|uniref:Thioredoxin n=1 Tax=Gordonia phage Commandaria TaxID=3038364 RepID=A0AAF0GIH8_9CAUD|nr:thioredoxin [Gordonia phage Commandaria]WGH20847.1 thioredoxin [Gordonia phage Commandaria]